MFTILEVSNAGSVISTWFVAGQLLASNTSSVYVPGARPSIKSSPLGVTPISDDQK